VNSGYRVKRIMSVFYFSKDMHVPYSILAYAYPRAMLKT